MMYSSIFVLCFASTAVLTAIVREEPLSLCSEYEFSCGDGGCVNHLSFCDGHVDCLDGSDEASCHLGIDAPDGNGLLLSSLSSRSKRQARNQCTRSQWQCRDKSCIGFDAKCDGIVDCADGSDETHALCRNNYCQSNWFRCSYGACVDGTAPCNGVQECADNSDELLPRCRNVTSEVRGQFKCDNGEFISATLHCDGVADCADGSDEDVKACAGKICPAYLFQCAYGACVDQGSDCNGITECHDGSDEAAELCNTTTGPIVPTSRPPTPTTPGKKPDPNGGCVLPPYPANGKYVVSGAANAVPGQAFDTVALNITCNPGYGLTGSGKSERICYFGTWSEEVTNCVRFCRLNKDPSVDYRCILSGNSDGTRDCNLYEPDGVSVRPECNSPNYYYSGVLPYMRCIDGSWDYVARCLPGLAKNGTNITILIKDKDQYEIHIGSFQYTVDNNPQRNQFKPVTPGSAQFTPVTPAESESAEYDIDEDDWRILSSNSLRPGLSNRNGQKPGVSLNIQGGKLIVNDKVVINNNDPNRIVFRD